MLWCYYRSKCNSCVWMVPLTSFFPCLLTATPIPLDSAKPKRSKLVFCCYTHAIIWFPPSFLAVNHHNNKNWVPSILTQNLWLIIMGMKQKKIQKNSKKKFKMADSKKLSFSKLPILKNIFCKFQRLVLGLVGLIDAKGIDVAQPIWSWDCLT